MLYHQEVKYLPWSKQKYSLYQGKIYQDETALELIEDGDSVNVFLDWFDGQKSYDYYSILALCLFNIKIPAKGFYDISLSFTDGDRKNLDINNLYYSFNDLVESETFKGYYHVPYYTDFVINENGDTLSMKYYRRNRKNIRKTWTVSKPIEAKRITGGYYTGRGRRDHDDIDGVSRHRVLALTFIKYYFDPLNLIVNHRNGIPGDDRLNNLEWVTYSQNTKHAYDNGLHSQKVVAVNIMNTNTGIIKRYPTIQACAEDNQLTAGFISSRLKKTNIGYSDGIRVWKDGETLPEIEMMRKTSMVRTVVARNVFSNQLVVYSSKDEAGRATGISGSMVAMHCEQSLYLPTNGYNFRYIDPDLDWPEYNQYQLKLFESSLGKMCIPRKIVLLLDDKEDIVDFYVDRDDFLIKHGISQSTMRKIMISGKKLNGLTIRLYDITAPL